MEFRPQRPSLLRPEAYDENDPDLIRDRKRNDEKLKGVFEGIFDKFDRDFTGIGDEIDVVTGKIVVDNGHLASMRDEQDIEGDNEAREFLRGLTAATADQNSEDDVDELATIITSAKRSTPKEKKSSSSNPLADAQTETAGQSSSGPAPAAQPPATPQAPLTTGRAGPSNTESMAFQPAGFPAQPNGALFQQIGQFVWAQLSSFMGQQNGPPPATDPKWTVPPLPVLRPPQPALMPTVTPSVTPSGPPLSPERATSPHRRSIWAPPGSRQKKRSLPRPSKDAPYIKNKVSKKAVSENSTTKQPETPAFLPDLSPATARVPITPSERSAYTANSSVRRRTGENRKRPGPKPKSRLSDRQKNAEREDPLANTTAEQEGNRAISESKRPRKKRRVLARVEVPSRKGASSPIRRHQQLPTPSTTAGGDSDESVKAPAASGQGSHAVQDPSRKSPQAEVMLPAVEDEADEQRGYEIPDSEAEGDEEQDEEWVEQPAGDPDVGQSELVNGDSHEDDEDDLGLSHSSPRKSSPTPGIVESIEQLLVPEPELDDIDELASDPPPRMIPLPSSPQVTIKHESYTPEPVSSYNISDLFTTPRTPASLTRKHKPLSRSFSARKAALLARMTPRASVAAREVVHSSPAEKVQRVRRRETGSPDPLADL